MAKKRRSLQSIFLPSFLLSTSPPSTSTSTPNSTRSIHRTPSSMSAYFSSSWSQSSASLRRNRSETISTTTSRNPSPPPDYLLDDDPFADLSRSPSYASSPTSSPTTSSFSPPGLSQPADSSLPRSPLSPSSSESPAPSRSTTTLATDGLPSTVSPPTRMARTSSVHARPAHRKPAFAPRPSLPSLHTLSQMNVVIPKKLRKGRVGARLPFEPWESDGSVAGSTTSQLDIIAPAPSDPFNHGPPDFTNDLDLYMDQDSDLETDRRGPPSRFDTNYRTQHPDHARQTSTFDDCIQEEALSYYTHSSSSSEDSPPTLSHTRSTSASSASTLFSPDVSPSPVLRNYSRRFPYDNIAHARTKSNSSQADPTSFPPEFDDLSYAESYSHFLSRPPSDLDLPDVPNSYATLRSPAIRIRAPHRSLFSHLESLYEPGSASTIRGPLHDWANGRSLPAVISQSWTSDDSKTELVDGSGWGGSSKQNSNGYSGGWDYGSGRGGMGGGGGGRENGSGGGGGWRGSGSGQGGDDGDHNRRSTNAQSAFSSDSGHCSSDEEEQTSTDDYGEDSPRPHDDTQSRQLSDHCSTDDEVPLAQRIPTALQAQQTIRKQVVDERDQRRKERALRRQQQQQQQESENRLQQATLRSPAADHSSSLGVALRSSPSMRHSRTKTLPGSSLRSFAAEDLTKKLLNVQDSPSSRAHHEEVSRDTFSQLKHVAGMRAKEEPVAKSSVQDRARVLRSARSFHKPTPRHFDDQPPTRTILAITRPRGDAHASNARSLPSDNARVVEKVGRRVSSEDDRKPGSSSGGRSSSTRTSVDLNPALQPRTRSVQQRQPVPPLPTTEVVHQQQPVAAKVQTTQQRIFIGDMQRFNIVEIGPSTSAKQVLETIETQGAIKDLGGAGGWMLWEVAMDFGMERPIRSFELISDVSESWNKDKTVNTFIVKATSLAPLLSPSAIPTSSPRHSGYVEWESKRGKWSKRWMELREHSLWLSKRDTGKDETFLCSLSAFDAYFVTRPYRSPKPFVFAVKSMDNMSFFENTADYLHVFSCGQKDGEKWIEKILLARSYILQQERNVLFTSPAVGSSPASSHVLSRVGTRKQQPAGHRTAQPLVHVSAPFTVVPTNPVFEPGSLLAQP